MTHDPLLPMLHLDGEQLPVEVAAPSGPVTVETFAGPVKVEWDATSPLTPLGQIVYFIEFLKVSGRFDALIGDCPLAYASPNAPAVRDVIGTWMLSVLAGHKRYAHITALRSDRVLAELLGLERIVSEDSVRRALKAMPEAEGLAWLQRHIDQCTHPLLGFFDDLRRRRKPCRLQECCVEASSAGQSLGCGQALRGACSLWRS